MNKVPSVTYFNQSLGAVHSECWSKYTFFTFHEKREKEKKQEKKKKNEAQTCVIWACTKTLVKGSLQQQLQNKNCLTLTLDFYLGHLRTKEEEV